MTELILDSPRARGLFVLTAHPEGCRVLSERMLARADAAFEKPLASAQGKTALVLGSTSFGYGSSTAIALRKAGFDAIVGVGFETAPAFRGENCTCVDECDALEPANTFWGPREPLILIVEIKESLN